MKSEEYNIEKLMEEGKPVIDEYGDTIFRQIKNYEYVIDDKRPDEEIINEYLKWYHEFYGESGNIYNNRFSDKSVTKKFNLIKKKLNTGLKLPVMIQCTLFFAGDGTKDGDYQFYKVGEDGHYTKEKTSEYPMYHRPHYGKDKSDDQFDGNMLMASEITGTYGSPIYLCKIKRIK